MNSLSRNLPPRAVRTTNRRADLLLVLGLFAVVVAAHAGSLSDGLFFDDYWHRATLRDYGWGFHDLTESATFNLPGRLAHLWWQEQPLQWRYARPVAMLFMKIELLLSGGYPVAVHAFALVWHALATMLVYLLARWALGQRGWAFLAGALFAFQPHSVFGVSWIAARNALVSGVFFLAATYVYATAPVIRKGRAVPLSGGRLLATLVLWGLALFSRETAIVFPLLMPVLDLVRGGKPLLGCRLRAHGLMWLLTAAYLYWRLRIFPVAGPPSIYFTAPSGVAYGLWGASKLLHMLFALIFQTPMFLGLATYDAASVSALVTHAVMAVLVAAIAVWYVLTSRHLETRWFWPVWVVITFLPVIPVFIMPHFAYLPAAGLAIMFAVMLRRLRGWWRPALTGFVVVGSLWSFGIYRYIWRGIVRSEQLIYADMRTNTPRPQPGTKLFFINLPVAGIYATAAMREAWGLDDLEGYVLTFAPHPLMMRKPCVVEPVGDRELIVSTEPPGYFSGLSGKMLLDGMRPGAPLTPGTLVPGELFDATVLAGDAQGITKLKFTFHRPLSSGDFYFYISSPVRPAYHLGFDATVTPASPSHEDMFERARAADPEVRRQAREQIVELARPLAIESGSIIQTDLRDPQLASDASLDRVESWWHLADAGRMLDEYLGWYEASQGMLRERERYFQIDGFVRRIIRSDLYLTGPAGE